MNGPDPSETSARLRDLVDDYCADLIDEAGVRELEAALLASGPARRYFAEYIQMHAELGFSARARRAASAALNRVAIGRRAGRSPRARVSWRPMAMAGVAI